MILQGINYDVWPFVPGTVLYHGSRGGIEGDIVPRSRPRADFGHGFYMCSDDLRARTLVLGQQPAFVYALTFDDFLLDDLRAVELSGVDWVYTILHNRRSSKAFSYSPLDHEIGRITDGADLIIGPIGDGKMATAVSLFERGDLTDKGLEACLECVPHGLQVVAKSERACRAIQIEVKSPIHEEEYGGIESYGRRERESVLEFMRHATATYASHGRRIDELVSSEDELERLQGAPVYCDAILSPTHCSHFA